MTTSMNIPAVPKDFEAIGRWFATTFQLLREQYQVWLLQFLILFGFSLFIGVIGVLLLVLMIPGFSLLTLTNTHVLTEALKTGAPAVLLPFIGVILLLAFIMSFFQLYLNAGIIYTVLKQIRGERIQATDIFCSGYAMLPIFGASILIGLAVVVSLCFCIIPVFFVPVFFMFTIPAILDRRLGATAGISFSSNIVKQNYWLFFVYGAVYVALTFVVQAVFNMIPIIGSLTNIALGFIGTVYFAVPYADMIAGGPHQRGSQPWTAGPQPYMPPAYTPPSEEKSDEA